MASLSTEERTALRDAVSQLLSDRSTEADVRRAMDTPLGYDPDLWHDLAEMRITGLVVDESFGGAGAGAVELEAVMEAAGAALLCGPLLGSCVLAAEFLQALDDEPAKARWLPPIAAGSRIAAAALTGDAGAWTPDAVSVAATRLEDFSPSVIRAAVNGGRPPVRVVSGGMTTSARPHCNWPLSERGPLSSREATPAKSLTLPKVTFCERMLPRGKATRA